MNAVGPDDAKRLVQLSSDPGALYGTFTTSGSGLGLHTVSSLVGNAYGIEDIATLISDRHVGWKLDGQPFVAWFHWPLAN